MSNNWTPYSPYSPYWPYTPSPPVQPIPLWAQPPQSVPIIPIPPGAPRIEPIPLPPMGFGGIGLHQLLAYANIPYIEYDVRRHPAFAFAPSGGLDWGKEPATDPHTSEMLIVCMVLPNKPEFAVRPLSSEYRFVTIHDVLAATHSAFREAAQEDDHWVPGFSSRRHNWAGLSEQCAHGTWLLHIE